jgi:hypothetical protein
MIAHLKNNQHAVPLQSWAQYLQKQQTALLIIPKDGQQHSQGTPITSQDTNHQ